MRRPEPVISSTVYTLPLLLVVLLVASAMSILAGCATLQKGTAALHKKTVEEARASGNEALATCYEGCEPSDFECMNTCEKAQY